MKHTDWISVKHKDGYNVLYWGTKEEFFEEENRDEFEDDILTFDQFGITDLVEVLENMMENWNWHSRAEYEPNMMLEALRASGATDDIIASYFRNFIISLENHMN